MSSEKEKEAEKDENEEEFVSTKRKDYLARPSGNKNIKIPPEHAHIIADAVYSAKGVLAIAARSLGISYATIMRYKRVYPEVEQAFLEANEGTKDWVESKLLRLCQNERHPDHAKAVMFFLSKRARDRGYGDRIDVRHQKAEPVPVQIVQFEKKAIDVTSKPIKKSENEDD